MINYICSEQYYHTVTAVRRNDAIKSPMTKVMDLFRHRSNSAVSEADKRKAVSFQIHNSTNAPTSMQWYFVFEYVYSQ